MSAHAYVLVANAGAGSTEEAAVGAAVAVLAAHGPTELRWTEEPAELVEVVGALDPDRTLVVAGGDGSMHTALAAVVHHQMADRPVGIVPLGTGNDFARNRSIPLDPVLAAGVVVDGVATATDAMRIAGEAVEPDGLPALVANNIHAGLGVRSARRAQSWKPYTRRLSYPLATAFEGVAGQTTDVVVSVAGEVVHDGPALAVLVLLGPSMGGGVEVMPDQPDRMDLVVLQPAEGRDRIDLLSAALRGKLHEARRAEHREASLVGIAARGSDTIDVDVDGELASYRGEIGLELVPGAWRVISPLGPATFR